VAPSSSFTRALRAAGRTLSRSALAGALAAFAGGCLDYEERIEARPDGSGTIAFHYKIPVLLAGFAGRGDADAVVPLSFDAVELRRIVEGAGLRASTLEVFDRDAERHVRLVLELDSLDDLRRLPRIRGHEVRFETDASTGDWVFRRSLRLEAAPTGALVGAALELARLRFACILPWTIRESNADSASDGVLRWERRLADLAAEPFVMTVRVAPPTILDKAAVVATGPVGLALLALLACGCAYALTRARGRRASMRSA